MRFMLLMLPGEMAENGTVPPPEFFGEMMKFNEEMRKAGILLALEGLHPSAKGARVSFPSGKPMVADGPFAECKEMVGGYWLIQVKSKEEAVAWATRCPHLGGEIIEVRQVQEMSEFSPEIQEAVGDLSGFDQIATKAKTPLC